MTYELDDDDVFPELYDYEEEIITARRGDSVLSLATLAVARQPGRARLFAAEIPLPGRS